MISRPLGAPTSGSGNCIAPSGQSEPGPAWATVRPSSGSPASQRSGEPPSPQPKVKGRDRTEAATAGSVKVELTTSLRAKTKDHVLHGRMGGWTVGLCLSFPFWKWE